MADTSMSPDATPMTDGDIAPPAGTQFAPAAPLKDAGVGFDGADTAPAGGVQSLKDSAAKLGQQASDKARGLAEEGKTRATDALGQLAQMLTDAAGTVDDKMGEQYGQYARSAAESVSGFAGQLQAKDVDALLEDARDLVRKSPAIAIGTAAAVGFVVARLLTAGLDQRDKA